MPLPLSVVIPFQFGVIKKLLLLEGSGYYVKQITLEHIKDMIRSTFDVVTFKLYNKKIGFEIPEDLLIHYIQQRKDFTNFVIEVVSTDSDDTKDPMAGVETTQPIIEQNTTNESSPNIIEENPCTTAVKQILQCELYQALDTPQGKELCRSFDMNNRLNDEQQTSLARLLANNEINKIIILDEPLVIDHKRYTHLANAITNRFPTERATTYINSQAESPIFMFTGKLVNEFNSIKFRYLEQLANIRYKQCGKNIQADFPEIRELRSYKGSLRSYLKPWQQTYDLRRIYLKNIEDPLMFYRDFICGSEGNGLQLIDYDFRRLYPENKSTLSDNWNQISERIFTEALVSGLRDVPLILDIYGNDRQLSGIMMFTYLLENYRSDEAAFQKDNPRNLIIHVDVDTYHLVDDFQRKYPPQSAHKPRIFVNGKIGEALLYYVLVDNCVYRQVGALEAIDFCLKCYHALHLSYFEEQIDAWTLIEQAFFNIHVRECNPLYKPLLEILKTP